MLSSTIIITILSLMGSVTARIYHNCGCKTNGEYNVELSKDTCTNWALSGEPHTHFDGYSCIDKGSGRGIDGNPWETHCKDVWEVAHAGNRGSAVGWCWH
ncbi:hypothetical protein Ptr902_03809 [Pyrenophora tritici-repentis]|uniref:Uncharacterized protein n=1 Tax=Pyrenophora tritici-repentis TaxID=45151 RepID=A0A317A1N0_9PLEO|nr:hypothetical protein A1F99_080740 [Pyrenophora tritici-repentis]KAF7572434.1 hypothetical protein PtrM4_099340 [Pyrenophora tritici-repentis]KAI0575946.1 hypothetical protein Alg130_09043 [Pyrenophora tritici-repentis]KAI0606732.1 hypothetical protein TUN205_09029 [Pyrenophora tritici-repentis]KAI0617421.1 hypothetical protein TUN199_10586 [Pyrenophora tritici-repentis]